MVAIRHILCPTDFSPCSDRALAYAGELAEKFAAKLTVLYMVPDVSTMVPDAVMPVPVGSPDLDELLDSGRAALAKRVASPDLAKHSPAIEVRAGSPETEIATAAQELSADMIVLGTHGRGGLAHFFLGSVAEKVIRHAHCPVLTIRG